MDVLSLIRRWHFREKMPIREISRRTKLSRNTITKYLASGEVEPKYPPRQAPSQLDPYAEQLRAMLRRSQSAPRKQKMSVREMHVRLVAMGYPGSYNRVAAFARDWHRAEHERLLTAPRKAFVPLAFAPGEAFQFDWSEDCVRIGGEKVKLQIAQFKLSHSRAFLLRAYWKQTHEMLFDAHTRSFAALGGVARRGIYDNMKTAVDKVKKGKGRVVNERFATMCAHYLYDPDFCNVASGWEKGVVEKNVQDSRRRIWIDATRIKFGSFTELNAWLGQRCRALWDEVRHPEHTQFSVAEMLEHERAHLMPMPVPFDGYVEKPARVSSTCLVSVARNRYSVPCERVGQMVSTRLYPGSVAIVADDTIVARHERLSNAGETRYDWQHYIPLLQRKPGALRNGAPFADMPEVLQRLRRGLLRNPGGDRVMAQVLAIVLSAGLDAVLVAIELALESGPPGKVSVEHVVNVLNRLNAQPIPPTAATLLKVSTPPLANTARYDSLRSDTVGNIVGVTTEGAGHED